ncbi:FAD binding domain-containing protein [Sulfitobacter albidus]|uniref:FAD binding domain-containing protein n=1 Tax=Sulfitobacter albidus TaxID=2829501 RepID=A0A975JDE1_9RHOB|nr:FAD binding domain-containing protein [Sulfitobacter albidus]QUJ76378.1 FAD binding domain-containing protein [Sulfitobacter albidus]
MSYHRPHALADALDIAATPAITVVAGGTDVYPAARQGRPFGTILDITRVQGLTGITQDDGGTRIGAATSWSDLVRADLPPAFDGLKCAARQVGSVQIQNAATLAGNLCNASPAADGVPPLLTLDASVEVASAARGSRRIPLGDFIRGVRQTALAPDELLTAIHIPQPPEGAGSCFEKLGSRRYLVISIAMVSALVAVDGNGRITHARIAAGSCSAVAQRLPALEAACLGQRPHDITVNSDHLAPLSPIDDVRGSAAYRRDAVATLCQRAIARSVPA